MIAASEPQEFIPSGRQQVKIHPGLPKLDQNDGFSLQSRSLDDIVLDRLKHVSLNNEANSKNVEWWTVRECPNYYHKQTDDYDDRKVTEECYRLNDKYYTEKSQFQDQKLDSWSWRTIDPDPGNNSKPPSRSRVSILGSEDSELWRSSSKYTKSVNDIRDSKLISKNHLAYVEEELYVKGPTAVWSRGVMSSSEISRNIICCYTLEQPITHALWCTFYVDRMSFARKLDILKKDIDQPIGEPLQTICLLDNFVMKVFANTGEDFIVSLPFQVSNAWATKYGIMIEKTTIVPNPKFANSKIALEMEKSSNFYTLTHPLDQFCPVALKNGPIQIFNNPSVRVIEVFSNPSICFTYDSNSGLHVIYRIRKLKYDECSDAIINKLQLWNSVHSPNSISSKAKHNLSIWSGHGAGLPLATGSPACSRATSLSNLVSPHNSRSQSPMAAISRCQSPSMSPFISGSSWANLSYSTHHESITGASIFGTTLDDSIQPKEVSPEICFEHRWIESSITQKSNFSATNSPASKAFISIDLVGQNYLCYLIPQRKQLILVRMDISNEDSLIFGPGYFLIAKDATPIPSLHMIALLEPSGQLMLYSGPTLIGKIHIGGVSAEFSCSVAHAVATPSVSTTSSIPRRSSLLPTCRTPAMTPKFDDFSPVFPEGNLKSNMLHSTVLTDQTCSEDSGETNIVALRDSLCDRITIKYIDNTLYRVRFPPIASSTLVGSCLTALRQSLQKDVAMTLLSKWYAMRNAPGPVDLTVLQEWELFTTLIYGSLGYDTAKLGIFKCETTSGVDEAKRQRTTLQGTESDYLEMLHCDQYKDISESIVHILRLQNVNVRSKSKINPAVKSQLNIQSFLFPYFRVVLFTLHLLYEDIKLNTMRLCELPLLVKLLHQIACDLRLQEYVLYYWKDFPEHCSYKMNNEISQMDENDLNKLQPLQIMGAYPINIIQHFCDILNGLDVKSYPFVKHVNHNSKQIIQIVGLIAANRYNRMNYDIESLVKNFAPPGSRVEPHPSSQMLFNSIDKGTFAEQVVMFLIENGITRRHLDFYPPAIALIIDEGLWPVREHPPTDWCPEAYYLLQRTDLAKQAQERFKGNEHVNTQTQLRDVLPTIKHYDTEAEDGMEDVECSILKLRFPDDQRVAEVRRLLQSSEPVNVNIPQRPDVTDHDFIEEQERHLFAICTRTMALSVGRGMFTMRTATPVITEALPIPRLCLTGKTPPRGASVELTHIETPPNMNSWPLFHNGVAAGLRISPDATNIDSSWIVFNRPKVNAETHMEHAGFLMALGLNGHLKHLAVMNMYDYLVQFREMISVGLLLGLAATKRGTMDMYITKMLSIHIEALLPPTSMELDIPQNIQVASLLGIGLVYQGSAHRHMTEVLLSEIGRPPGPEMENSLDRESYSLAAGLALGLVTLKQGGLPSIFPDLRVPDTLHYYMVGGNKRPLTGSQKDKYKVPSFQIREGTTVNLDVTSPGATLALGLMYLGTGNKAIADWMKPPNTQYLLDFIRPDFLMLRIISGALVMWDDIEATIDWVDGQVPDAIRPFCLERPNDEIEMDIDYEAMNQVYCNIIAGACFALGLRYAGTANEETFQTLLHYCKMFTSLTVRSIAELAGKSTIETCLNLILLSAAMVVAGTGRLEIIRICRHLRKRVGVASSSVVTYGSHLATHMALGLLFLGGGRYSLSNSPPSVAAMLCAFFPKFPTHSNDNRYHLQAFRHLYVLAVEPRLIIPRDILSGKMCYVHFSLVKLDGSVEMMKAPCLLPDLNSLAQVSVQDERYWTVVFERGKNWDQLHALLQSSGIVKVKQRAGFLTYQEDPFGTRSLVAKVLIQDNVVPWTPNPDDILAFSSEPYVKNFINYFLTPRQNTDENLEERTLRLSLTIALYECVVKDKLLILPIWVYFIKTIHSLRNMPRVLQIWQLKLLFTIVTSGTNSNKLISSEVGLSMRQKIIKILEEWEPELHHILVSYVCGKPLPRLSMADQRKLVTYVTVTDLPFNLNIASDVNRLQLFCELNNHGYRVDTCNKIVDLVCGK